MKQFQKQKKQSTVASNDLEEIPKALGFKSIEKMMTEPPEMTEEQVLMVAKIAIGMIH